MKLPQNLLSPGTYTKPRFFLCEVDKTRICQLQTTNTKGSFKFNGLSELSFETARIYNDALTGATKINPFYNKIEALRLIEIEGIGYFELQGPELISDGIKESKSCTAKSYECVLAQKYLTDFYINTGEVNSVEVIYAENNNIGIVPVTLYNPANKELSLLHLVLEKVYGWSIGHVDSSLQKLSRSFEVDRESVYDFLINEVCEKFNCYIVFDTINNTINIYAESLTSKFIGDGETKVFTISPPFEKIGTVSIDGYKTTRWEYNSETGALRLEDSPESGSHIEIIDGALTEWETDVFITFDNLSQEMQISYDAEAIKTVLTVTYGENGDIREVNLGLPYIVDLSYFHTVDWMGQDLYDAYTAYLQKTNKYQTQYTDNSLEMLDIAGHIDFEENRLSLEYSIAQSVNSETIGTYYVRGGSEPNYYYTEVTLPAEYNADITYYSLDTANLNETKVSNIYTVMKMYYNSEENWEEELNKLSDDFKFMQDLNYTFDDLNNDLKNAESIMQKDLAVNKFLNEIFNEVGRIPLKQLYYESYKKIQITNIEAGWSQRESQNYWYYYPVVLFLNVIESEISKRDENINNYKNRYQELQNTNAEISNSLLIENNFTDGQLIRLNAFLREDELQLDDIVETSEDTIADSFKIKQDAMESGKIELQKLCQPQLQFSMSMANIYALPEFAPIINQFQLGNVIKVGLRPDYIKQSRLLQVDIGFDNFSDFSCEFGELTSLRTQSDIHADLLANAISAGKSVAQNASYWSKGTEQANSIDLRLQEGLLNSIDALRAMDGSQNAYIDKYGIHLEVIDPVTGEIGDKRVWMVNNQIVFTDDGFKTSKSVLGEFKVDGITYYGLLAQAVIAGYIEGSQMIGGTIKIGLQDNGAYAFEVREDGSVIMNGGSSIDGYVTSDELIKISESTPIISDVQPVEAKDGQIWLNTATSPSTLMIYDNGKWVYFSQQDGGRVYTSRPTTYQTGDLWVLAQGETYISNDITYTIGSILKADDDLNWIDASPNITNTLSNVQQYFDFNKSTGLRIGQRDEKFHVNVSSTKMGFYEGDTEVVSISNKAANIDNLTVEKGLTVDCSTTLKGDTIMQKTINNKAYKYVWQVEESNGSLSLAIGQ